MANFAPFLEFKPGWESSFPHSLTAVGASLYFGAVYSEYSRGAALFKTDGTPQGTVRLTDEGLGVYSSLVNFQGKLYFLNNSMVYTSDGTLQGTVPVRDQNGNMLLSHVPLNVVGGRLYGVIHGPGFSHRDATLWNLDRPGAEPRMLAYSSDFSGDDRYPITPPTYSQLVSGSNATYWVTSFSGHGGGSSIQRWDHRTNQVSYVSTPQYAAAMEVFRNELYFIGGQRSNSWSPVTYSLMHLTRLGAEPVLVKSLGVTSRTEPVPPLLKTVGDQLVFLNKTEAGDLQIWRSDGTTEGTTVIRNLPPGRMDSGSLAWPGYQFQVYRNRLYLFVFARYGGGLWTSDGTAAGTTLLFSEPYIGIRKFVNGRLYFEVSLPVEPSGFSQVALYSTNGTLAGTREEYRTTNYQRPGEMAQVGDMQFLVTGTTETGNELWYRRQPASPLTGDVNRDERVDFIDFALLRAHFGQSGQSGDTGDLDGDGDVDFQDFTLLRRAWR